MQERVPGPAWPLILVVAAAALSAAAPVRAQTAPELPAELGSDADPAPAPAAPLLFDDVQMRGEPALVQASQHWQAGQFEQVVAVIRPLAESGNREAPVRAGWSLFPGTGRVPQDEEQAAQWWRKAAEQGLARAQNELAVVLSDGRGVPAEPQQAVFWYRKAAEQGFGWAQFYLGKTYAEGRGVARNQTQAVGWVRKAAEQGYTEAQNALGTLYFRGSGIARNLAQCGPVVLAGCGERPGSGRAESAAHAAWLAEKTVAHCHRSPRRTRRGGSRHPHRNRSRICLRDRSTEGRLGGGLSRDRAHRRVHPRRRAAQQVRNRQVHCARGCSHFGRKP